MACPCRNQNKIVTPKVPKPVQSPIPAINREDRQPALPIEIGRRTRP